MDRKKLQIRKMIEEDIDFLIRANQEVHEATGQENEIYQFRERILCDILSSTPKASIMVAEYDTKPIAMALYSTVYFADEGEVMWLSNIFVEQEYRGEKVAKKIIQSLKEICKEKGYYAICGAVSNSNRNSIHFFDSIDSKWINDFKMVVIK